MRSWVLLVQLGKTERYNKCKIVVNVYELSEGLSAFLHFSECSLQCECLFSLSVCDTNSSCQTVGKWHEMHGRMQGLTTIL